MRQRSAWADPCGAALWLQADSRVRKNRGMPSWPTENNEERQMSFMQRRVACLLAAAAVVSALALVPLASAQTPGVTLFGIIDTGVEYVTDAGPTGRGLW